MHGSSSTLKGGTLAPNHDAAWILWLAQQVLGGRELYRDLIEINPPLIIWLNLPLAWFAQLTGWPITSVWMGALLLGGTGLTLLTLALGRPIVPRRRWPLLGLALPLVAGPLAGTDLGQRDHLALLLLLPFVVLSVRRVSGIPTRHTWALGVLAGVGLALKFYLAPAWLFLLLWRRSWQAEDWAVIAAGVAYLLAVQVFAPGYLPLAVFLGPLYAQFGSAARLDLLTDRLASALLLITVVYLLMRRAGSRSPLAEGLIVAGFGFLAGVLLHGKGWSYHWYPVEATAVLALLALPRPAFRAAWLSFAAALVLIALSVARRVITDASDRAKRHAEAVRGSTAMQLVPGAETVAVLSVNLTDAWPWALREEWTLRVPCLWFLQSAYPWGSPPQYRAPQKMPRDERFLFDVVVQDLTRRPPDLLLVESVEANASRSGPPGLDVLIYFGQDPRFARFMLGYHQVRNLDGLLLYQRRWGRGPSP